MTPFQLIKKYHLQNPLTLIQVGASGGQEIEEFISNGIKQALLIEPLDMPFSILSARVANIENYLAYKALAHSINGTIVDFHVASNGGMSSSIFSPNKHLATFPHVLFPEKISLTGFRLDSIVAFLKNSEKIQFSYPDIMYLDVQGAELVVLQGSGELLEHTKYIWTEVGVGDGYNGGATYRDIINYLATYKFQLIYFECELGAFGDALFAKIE